MQIRSCAFPVSSVLTVTNEVRLFVKGIVAMIAIPTRKSGGSRRQGHDLAGVMNGAFGFVHESDYSKTVETNGKSVTLQIQEVMECGPSLPSIFNGKISVS